jgi:glycosyltransferase involved in cell wall biosynthesis
LKRRLVIITEIIAPYRIPVFNALARREEIDLHVIFLSETDPGLRKWRVYREEIRFSHEVLSSQRLRFAGIEILATRGIARALIAARPEFILAGGYNYPATWQAQKWARRNNVPFLLWSESNFQDSRKRLWWVESAKRRFIAGCQGYLVPGKSAREYLKTFGVPEASIFVAPNAVDVDRFSRAAAAARVDVTVRQHLGLPGRYLLFVGRLVVSKGVFDLLEAYAKLPEETRRWVGLVFVGDGEEQELLKQRAREIDPGQVAFYGFMQRDELPAFYGFADALVFPTHSDPWGLVVNEAEACGLPVIATDVAGCVADLVCNGENGFVVPAKNQTELSRSMHAVLQDANVRERMGRRSREISSRFTPEAWADGVIAAVKRMQDVNRG